MKKYIKRLLCSMGVVCMMFSMLQCSAYAASFDNNEIDSVVEAKYALMRRAQAEHMNRTKTASNFATEEANKILIQMSCGLTENSEYNRQKLERAGIYILDMPIEDISTQGISPDASCVVMNRPIVSYDANTSCWSVTGGGYYKDLSWIPNNIVESKKNVGGYDAYGVSYTNVKGTYSARIVKQYAYISDGVGTEKTSNARSFGGDKTGYGFQFQDYTWRVNDPSHMPIGHDYYVGKHFATQLVYSNDFVNFSGTATTFHIHTYDKAQLKSVTLSTSGVSAVIDFSESSFKAFSSETKF